MILGYVYLKTVKTINLSLPMKTIGIKEDKMALFHLTIISKN